MDEQDRTGGGEETYKTLVRVFPDGKCLWSSPALFKAICEIDVSYFPLDQQTCRLKFGSWTYNSSRLKLTTKDTKFPTDDFIKNGEWRITKVIIKAYERPYGDGDSYMDVTMTVGMTRIFLDYLINLVIPCLMISCMTFLGKQCFVLFFVKLDYSDCINKFVKDTMENRKLSGFLFGS